MNTTRNLLQFVMFLCMGLIAVACSNEEITDSSGPTVSSVQISATLPQETPLTRALPIMEGYKLRCILEVWTQGDTPTLKHRQEIAALKGEASFVFDFELAETGNYDCLMWADYVAENAKTQNLELDGYTYMHYEDRFYSTTQNLKQVAIKDTKDAGLFNNDACDAFYDKFVLEKAGETYKSTAELARPFSKLIIKEKNLDAYKTCSQMLVSYKVPSGFDVGAEAPLSEESIIEWTRTDMTNTPADDCTLFSNYIFATSNQTSLGNIDLTFTIGDDIRDITIPAGVPIIRNTRIIANGALISDQIFEGDINFGFDFSTDWEKDIDAGDPMEEKPQVGSFYYKDGTWSKEYKGTDDNPAIGIIFALKNDANSTCKDDTKANYPDITFAEEEIQGWVVALQDAIDSQQAIITQELTAEYGINPYEGGKIPDVAGFKNTNIYIAIDASKDTAPITGLKTFKEKYATPKNTSGWYIPAGSQMEELLKVYAQKPSGEVAELTYNIVGSQLKELQNLQQAQLLQAANYWSSSTATSKNKIWPRRFVTSKSESYGNSGTNGTTGCPASLRLILTF